MNTASIGLNQIPATRSRLEEKLYAKVAWRLLPFLFICYVAAYLDRVNIGFAKLQMLNDLQFSETVYGLGAGIFFIGYFIFEVPSNVIMHRVGARMWIGRIMITWALLSAATLFATTPAMFYAIRFLLGVAAAGFFPGIVLYLTNSIRAAQWLTAEEKQILEENVAKEKSAEATHFLSGVFGNGKVWLMAAIFFCCLLGLYGFCLFFFF